MMGPKPWHNDPVVVSIHERDGGAVATITINNPKRLNSLSTAVLDAFISKISTIVDTSNLRCVIITGAECATPPQAFIGGADISEAKDFSDAQTARSFINKIHLACQALRELPVPVIARINGHALGGGLLIAAAADLRVATLEARFGMPEVQRGVPSTVESALLPAQIGAARARRLMMLGDTISAATAESWGLVDRVIAEEDLDDAVEEWVQMLLKAGPSGLAAQKRLMLVWEQVPLKGAIEAGIWEFGRAFEGEAEGKRMMTAFASQNKQRKNKL